MSDFPQGRYLVTGAAGFIGVHLCERLVEAGCEVVGLDNFITGSRENLVGLEGNARFEFLEQDVTQPLKFSGEFAGVFHFASPASPVDYYKYPIETLQVGSIGAENVLNLADAFQCPIVVASTSEVYGDPLEHPQKETYWGHVNPIGPRSCYDESKRYQEALAMAFHRTRGVDTKLVRIFNTYGPRMRINDGRVVPNFMTQALSGKDLTVYGDGSQTRSFCFVDDLVEGILRIFKQGDNNPINLGNPFEISILEFANTILQLTGGKGKIDFKPLPQDDPKTRCPDISRAREMLSWEPKVGLEEGLEKSIEYFGNRAK